MPRRRQQLRVVRSVSAKSKRGGKLVSLFHGAGVSEPSLRSMKKAGLRKVRGKRMYVPIKKRRSGRFTVVRCYRSRAPKRTRVRTRRRL